MANGVSCGHSCFKFSLVLKVHGNNVLLLPRALGTGMLVQELNLST